MKFRRQLLSFLRTSHRAVLLSAVVGMVSCSGSQDQGTVSYLGQNPPGKTAALFAPGIISTDQMEHSSPAFSPDGSVVLWTVVPDGFSGPAYLMEMKFSQGGWSAPYRASFNDSIADTYYPSFSTDGKTLYFSSRRKVPEPFTPQGDIRMWHVKREDKGWGIPMPVDSIISRGSEFAHSVTKDGIIYFSSGFLNDPLKNRSGWSLFKRVPTSLEKHKIEPLPYPINSLGFEDGPFIAPDESFLIFESDRLEGMGGTDLYICFRNDAGQWTVPVSMGPAINSPFFERFAKLSPDGKYLFFGSSRGEKEGHPGFDIYWIDAGIIEELRQSFVNTVPIDNVNGRALLTALDESAWAEAATSLNNYFRNHPADGDAIFTKVLILKKEGKLTEAADFLRAHQNIFPQNVNYTMETAALEMGLGNQPEADKLLDSLLIEKDQLYNRYTFISNSLFDMADYTNSDYYFDKAMAVNMWSFGYFRRAREYALIKENNLAYGQLGLAIKNGFTDRQHFENEAAFAPLKGSEQWKTLMELLD